MTVKLMTELDLAGKRVLIREDLNVPIKDGSVTSDARIRAALPSIQHALKAGAKVILMSHLGRPTEGEYNLDFSMEPVANTSVICLDSRSTRAELDQWSLSSPPVKWLFWKMYALTRARKRTTTLLPKPTPTSAISL